MLSRNLFCCSTVCFVVAPWEEQNELGGTVDVRHWRLSLAPAWEFEEAQILGHFGVALLHVANVLRGRPLPNTVPKFQ